MTKALAMTLLASSAFFVGAGGLGAPALLYLAAAGIGKLGVADGGDLTINKLSEEVTTWCRRKQT